MKSSVTFAALLLFVAALTSQLGGCSVLLEYEELPAAGGSGGIGGAGGMDTAPQCVAPSDCPQSADDNECRKTICDEGSCVITYEAPGKFVSDDETGNCMVTACDGQGEITVQPGDDPPFDANDCTEDVCEDGVPSNPPVDADTPCGSSDLTTCNGNGECVGCFQDDHCDEDNGCQDHYCDGNGTCQVNIFPDDTLCEDDGNFCNGVEICSNGTCNSPGDPCPGPDDDADCEESCNETADACNAPDMNGSSCDDGLFCNGADFCQNNGECTHHGSPCAGASDGDSNCSESCDEENNSCDFPDPDGSPCPDDGSYCTGTESCQGGICSSSGDPCVGADNDDNCTESCNEVDNNCSGNDPDGSTCSDNLFCTGADTCQSGVCVGGPDPCPGPDNDNNCAESCDETANDCNANDSNGVSCLSDGVFCNGTEVCQAGTCESPGDPCPGPDNDNNCNESCNEGAKNCKAKDPDGASCYLGKKCINGGCLTIHLPKEGLPNTQTNN